MESSATVFLLTAPIGAAATLGNLFVLAMALRDVFDAGERICTNNHVFHSVLTANQALAALFFGAAHSAAFLIGAPLLDAVLQTLTLGAALSVALIALDRVFCVALRSSTPQPTLASTQRRRAALAVGASWLSAASVVLAPLPPPSRLVALILTQFVIPTLALLAAQFGVALRLRKHGRHVAKTNALLMLSVFHFVIGMGPLTAALALPLTQLTLTHVPAVTYAALSPIIYGWLSKPIRKGIRKQMSGLTKLWNKGGTITAERRLSLKVIAGGVDYKLASPQIFIVALPVGIHV